VRPHLFLCIAAKKEIAAPGERKKNAWVRDMPSVESASLKSELPGNSVSALTAAPGAALYEYGAFPHHHKGGAEGRLSLRAERSNPFLIGAPTWRLVEPKNGTAAKPRLTAFHSCAGSLSLNAQLRRGRTF